MNECQSSEVNRRNKTDDIADNPSANGNQHRFSIKTTNSIELLHDFHDSGHGFPVFTTGKRDRVNTDPASLKVSNRTCERPSWPKCYNRLLGDYDRVACIHAGTDRGIVKQAIGDRNHIATAIGKCNINSGYITHLAGSPER